MECDGVSNGAMESCSCVGENVEDVWIVVEVEKENVDDDRGVLAVGMMAWTSVVFANVAVDDEEILEDGTEKESGRVEVE